DPSFLAEFAAESLEPVLGKHRSRTGDVAKHLAEFALSDAKTGSVYWSRFLNGKIYAGDRFVTELSGQQAWAHVMGILRHAGYKMVYLLIDEFEEIDYQQPKSTALRAFLADF